MDISAKQKLQSVETICLTGATGLVGSEVLRLLAGAFKGEIRILVRNPQALPFIKGENIRLFRGDIRMVPADFIPGGKHAVIHCASKVRDADGTGFESVNVAGTSALAARLHEGTRIVFYNSSMSVYGNGQQIRLRETRPTNPQTALARSRKDAEDILFERAGQIGCHAIALRPRFIVSPAERYFLPQLVKFARLGLSIGSGEQAFSIIGAADYAQIMVGLLAEMNSNYAAHPSWRPEVAPLNVAYQQTITLGQMLRICRGEPVAGQGHGSSLHSVPTAMLRVMEAIPGRTMEKLSEKAGLLGYEHSLDVSRLAQLLPTPLLNKDPALVLAKALTEQRIVEAS